MRPDELTVSDLLFDAAAPLAAFDRLDFEARWNLAWPFEFDESAQPVVLRMIGAGFVELLPSDRLGRVYVGLTPRGGAAWEALRSPPWPLYVTVMCRCLPSGTRWISRIRAGSRSALEDVVGPRDGPHLSSTRLKLVQASSKRLVPWKPADSDVHVAFVTADHPVAWSEDQLVTAPRRRWWTTAADLGKL